MDISNLSSLKERKLSGSVLDFLAATLAQALEEAKDVKEEEVVECTSSN